MKSTRYAFSRVLAALLAASALVVGFTGCNPEVQTEYVDNYYYVLPLSAEDEIAGTWNDGYSDTVISAVSVTSSYGTHDGITVYLLKLTETSGYVYFQLKSDVGGWYQDEN